MTASSTGSTPQPAPHSPLFPAGGALPEISRGPFGGLAVGILVFYLVIRFGMAHDFVLYRFGVNSRYAFVTIPILVLASLLSGALLRVVSSPIGIWISAFVLWMGVSIPTSVWRGGSAQVLRDYLQSDYMIFLVVGSLAVSLADQKRVMYALAAAMPIFVFIVAVSAGFNRYGRYTMNFGTYGNPNSIATHILFLGPVVVFFMLERTRFGIGVVMALSTLLAGTVYFLRVGSRSGLIALGCVLAVGFWWLPLSRKILAFVLLLVVLPGAIMVMPKSALFRYRTMFSSVSESDLEGLDEDLLITAVGSSAVRRQKLLDSIITTFKNPIFGVGPGQYVVHAADQAKMEGRKADWLVTHNTYTQVSSEMGLVGLFFYLGMLFTTGLALRRVCKSVRGIPRLRSTHRMASCLLLSWIGYCVFSAFDSVAYTQYAPLLAGLAFGVGTLAKRELQAAAAAPGLS